MKLAILSGLAAFLAVTGGAVLDPRNTAWLLSHPDPTQSFLGWEFFRQAPLFQLPFGANPAYGMEIGSSVVFTDSIPLLAFLFKPLAPLLPAPFQYLGLWLLLSFVLQSVFAYGLLRRFVPDRWLSLAGSAFFVIAPVCLARLEFHSALFGQWLVLGALYCYFAPRYSAAAWMLLLAASTLVHFYLLFMVGAIWCADLWQRRWRNQIAWRAAAANLAGGACLTLGLMWLAGYFVLGTAVGECCYGRFGMNLLSPLDADGSWSQLLPDLAGVHNRLEAFNYLGSGMLLLALLAALPLWPRRERLVDRTSVVPLLALSLGLIVLALSNRVTLGSLVVFEYPVPGRLATLADGLRSSARMFWPVYYLIYLAVLVTLLRRLPRGAALALCAGALVVQIADSSAALKHLHERFTRASPAPSPLRSALWGEIGKRYKQVTFVLPRNAMDAHSPWTGFAVEHGMSINFGYFARVNPERVDAARSALEAAVLDNALARDSLYVFESGGLWTVARAHARPSDAAGVLDGFRILAPDLKNCTGCALDDVRADAPARYPLGERVSFGKGGSGQRYSGAGWYWPDDHGTWSVSREASLVFDLGSGPPRDLVLSIEGHAFVVPQLPRQEIDVLVNRTVVGSLVYSAPAAIESRTVSIPRAALAQAAGPVLVQFRFRDAKSRHELGWSDERYRLGLYLIAASLSAAAP